MRMLNLGKATNVPKLNEDKAIETGSQLLSELIFIAIVSVWLTYEFRKSSEKEEAKQLKADRERQTLSEQVSNATENQVG